MLIQMVPSFDSLEASSNGATELLLKLKSIHENAATVIEETVMTISQSLMRLRT
jgi:hypothetical protein